MNILEVRNVTKQYAAHRALNHVSMNVPQGVIFGLLGPNGAGKTSLIRIITQITAADQGEVLFNGEPLAPEHIYKVGYLPEERGLYKKMEVGEQLLYFAQLKGMSREVALSKLKIWVEKFEIKDWWKKKVEELSKGMQQKIQFIATVLHEPELLILDEPFSGFDPINVELITGEILKLKAKGCSIIFSTHRMESVEQLCDYIVLINRSEKILEGSMKSVRERFRTHTYEIDYTGNELRSDPDAEVLSTIHLDEVHKRSTVKLQNKTPNQLLRQVIGEVEVNRFEELLPTMQEIFINVVTDSAVQASSL